MISFCIRHLLSVGPLVPQGPCGENYFMMSFLAWCLFRSGFRFIGGFALSSDAMGDFMPTLLGPNVADGTNFVTINACQTNLSLSKHKIPMTSHHLNE